jgi:hypothetical protein
MFTGSSRIELGGKNIIILYSKIIRKCKDLDPNTRTTCACCVYCDIPRLQEGRDGIRWSARLGPNPELSVTIDP